MAIMIPTDGYFDERSGERKMFKALKSLDDDFYVFHSYKVVRLIPDKGLNENEIDFLIFNPKYGCLFIECKNSKICRESNGDWQYLVTNNGIIEKIKMKDPFDQAFTGQHNLFNKFLEIYPEEKDIIKRCKFMISVWLPKYTRQEIKEMDLGVSVTKEIIMTKEALYDPNELKRQIMFLMDRMSKVHLVCKYSEEKIILNGSGYRHNLSFDESMRFYRRVLCPTFKTIVDVKKDYEQTYIELLEEQYVVLDFLKYQRTAAISGCSGTGKTLVAIERARRLSENGENVLFLCYNRNLIEVLKDNYQSVLKNVDFYTLDGYACSKCNTTYDKISYYDLHKVIDNEIFQNKFKYNHIIVDEGQDFGRDNIDQSKILDLFYEYGSGEYSEKNNTSFFIFYDKNQIVNSTKIPDYIQNVESKLTLHKNCRNTKNIARTAFSLIDKKIDVYDRAFLGDMPQFILYNNEKVFFEKINSLIEKLNKPDKGDTVIISCGDSLRNSIIYSNMINEKNGNKHFYRDNNYTTEVFTARTFKGLEADNVILIDINNDVFSENNKNFYVAASRAKKELYILINKNDIDVDSVLEKRFPNSRKNGDRIRQLTLEMGGLYISK